MLPEATIKLIISCVSAVQFQGVARNWRAIDWGLSQQSSIYHIKDTAPPLAIKLGP